MVDCVAEVAVVGIGCRFPGGVETPEALWRLLCGQIDATMEVPEDRWGIKRFYDAGISVPNKTYMRRGAFIDQKIDEMDPLFFGISPREAVIMDPQQRLLLEVVWEAMEDGGVIPASLSTARTGVFIGTFSLDWLVACGSPLNRPLITDHFAATAASATMLAARVAHVFDLHGPCMSIDTACSSSLVAIHQACVSLLSGESDVALAGGVNMMMAPPASITMSKGHFLSPDGRCKSFSADADGYGRGEGCGILILKRLEDARRDGDIIHGVIAGSGINHDGRTLSLTMPSEQAQEALVLGVAAKAGIALEQIAYVEAHGTGTPVGDPIEARALGKAIGTRRPRETPLVIGSVKANLGHLEAAAGVAGLIKALLCLRHGVVPPQVNLAELNPSIPFGELGIEVARHGMTPLLGDGRTLYAGVNSFGYGGTNAVALLRAPDEAENPAVPAQHGANLPSDCFVLPLSAMSDASLKRLAQSYADLLSNDDGPTAGDICFSSAVCRTRLQNQAVVFGRDRARLAEGLIALAGGARNDAVITGRRQNSDGQKIAFIFSGMGSQWKGMGRGLLRQAPEPVLDVVARADAYFQRLSGWSIRDEIARPDDTSRINETAVAQPAIFLVQVALVELFRFHGIQPHAVAGHSVGEVAASYAAGALTLEDAVTVIYHRSQTQARLAGQGTMLAVAMSGEDAAGRLLPGYEDHVSVAALNSGRSCTLSGSSAVLEELAARCERDGIFNRLLSVEVPYHSVFMERIREDLQDALRSLTPQPPVTRLYSTMTGALWNDDDRHDASYWYANARRPVLYHQAMRALLDDGYRVFVEIGAHPVLSGLTREVAQEANCTVDVIATLSRKEPEDTVMARAVARLCMAGVVLDWARLTGGRRTSLPHYPWSRSHFWSETEASRRDRLDGTVHPVLGMPAPELSMQSWTADVNGNYMPWLRDHKVDGIVVFPAAGYIEGALALHRQADRSDGAILEDLDIGQALLLDGAVPPVMGWVLDPDTRVLTVSSRRWEDGDGEWVRHCRMRVLSSQPWEAPRIDPEMLQDEEMQDAPVEEFYRRIADHGLSYGPAFQVIRELKARKGVAFARLALSEWEQAEVSEYFIHPALLDGAFQTMIGAGYDPDDDRVFIPTGARRIIYRGGRHANLLVRTVLTERAKNRIEGEIHLFSDDGAPVAEILGFTAVAIRAGGESLSGSSIRRHFYRPVWIDGELPPVFAEPLTVQAFGRDNAFLDRLKQVLLAHGMTAISGEPDLPQAAASADIMLYVCAEDEGETGFDGLSHFLSCVKAIAPSGGGKANPRFVLVTRGAVSADLPALEEIRTGQAALRGFARGFAAEYPELSVRIVDIGSGIDEALLRQLCAELVQEDTEDDIILRPGRRAAGRLARCETKPDPGVTAFDPEETAEGRIVGVRLTSASTGGLERLRHERFVCAAPGPGQVLFKTLAAALNFKDVLKAMGFLPGSVVENTFHGESLGMEAAVEAVAVGEGVEGFTPGARYVVSWPGCFASHFTAPAQDVFALPLDRLGSPLEAATLPVAYVTAYHALSRLARLESGETVLIHAGTGGVGLAAIELARRAGARVFATAGSPEKRQYLTDLGCEGVWDSRSLEFADGVRGKTGGRGVDVVLNSLSGDAQLESLNIVAPYGRFVEIGKKDIWEKRGLSLAPFNENLSFFSLDLDRMMLERPALMRSLLTDVASLLAKGEARPLPLTAFAPADAADAFRFLASAKHIGKVVLDYTRLDGLKATPLPRPRAHVRPDAAYLVTGGLSGFGLETARWLVEQGARNLILLGRRSAEDAGFTEHQPWFDAAGAVVQTVAADVADEEAMKDVITGLASAPGLPPLRGVFHCAAVLDDALVHNLDEARIGHVLRAKAAGAIILDRLTRGLRLDYFVLYSSVTTLLGNIGQAAYIAANAVLDAVAANRWQAGEAALAVDWGAIGDAGMLTRNEAAARALEAAGLESMPAQEALAALPGLLALETPQLACVKIDWTRWTKMFPHGETLARFSQVRLADELGAAGGARLAALLALPEEKRLPYVVEHVKILIAQTLHLEPETIDESARLSELGIDSLAGVELQTALRVEFGVEISILVLARDENIRKMSEFLLNRIRLGQAPRLP